MKNFLLTIVAMLALTVSLSATNFYVRSDQGDPLTWSAMSSYGSIFSTSSSSQVNPTAWPTSNDRIYNNAGVQLIINTQGFGNTLGSDLIYIQNAGSSIICNVPFELKRNLYSNNNSDGHLTYFSEITTEGSNSAPKIYGELEIGDLNVKNNVLLSFQSSSTRTSKVVITGSITIESGSTLDVGSVVTAPEIIYKPADGHYGGIVGLAGTINTDTYQFTQNLESEYAVGGSINGGWLHINSPFGMDETDLTDQGYTTGFVGASYPAWSFVNVQTWDETEDGGTEPGGEGHWFGPDDTEFNAARGMGISYFAISSDFLDDNPTGYGGRTITTEGTVSTATFNFNVSYTPANYTNIEPGQNHISNPFIGFLDFSDLTRSNISESYSIFNNTTGEYENYSPGFPDGMADGLIPPGHGFWVFATGSSPSLSAGATNFAAESSGDLADADAMVFAPGGDLSNTNAIFDFDDDAEYELGSNGSFVWVAGEGSTSDTYEGTFAVIDLSPNLGYTEYMTLKGVYGTSFTNHTFDFKLDNPNLVLKYKRWNNFIDGWESTWHTIDATEQASMESSGISTLVIDSDGDTEDEAGFSNMLYVAISMPYLPFGPDDTDDLEETVTVFDNYSSYTFEAPQDDDYRLDVYDVSGRLVHSAEFSGFTYQLNGINKSGVYIYKLIGLKKTYSGKLYKR